ncbi:ABC transporter substrate-binding protein [Candidatus Roizmanbacteria bacterium]|nr:ABC transporter substrate-binding protein [Candidatus Roizmanbacteria bacterium]
MHTLWRKLRMTGWLIQSLVKRYYIHLCIAFLSGGLLVSSAWRFHDTIRSFVFPSRQIIGVVGSYEPTKLPSFIQYLISVGFTEIDSSGRPQPLLARSWEISKDGKRYFFHLSENMTWHDGSEFTAHDVNYNFRDVVIAPADRYTLKVELTDPFAPLPTLLTRPLFKTGLVGLGEYQVLSLELTENTVNRLVLRNTASTTDSENPQFIEFRFYPTLELASLAFRLGEIDTLEQLASPEPFVSEPNVIVTEHVQYDRFVGLFYNLHKELLRQKELRQALSYATPIPDGVRARSPIPEDSWAFNGNAKQYSYNEELVKNLLTKADVASESAKLGLFTFPEYYDMATNIVTSWNKAGIPSEVRVVQSFPPEFDVFLGVQEIPPDPDQYPLWHSTQLETNITGYNNPKIDKLLEEGRKEQDKEKRKEIYWEFQRYVMEDAPAHFLIHPTVYTISRK